MARAIEATGKRMNTRMMMLYPVPEGYDRINATGPCDYCKVLAPPWASPSIVPLIAHRYASPRPTSPTSWRWRPARRSCSP